MTAEVFPFFSPMPEPLPLYETLETRLLEEFPDMRIRVTKTQISFSNRYGFACASLPLRRRKGWPAVCLILSFGLPFRLDSPRIAMAAEPYPNRWTHHVCLQDAGEIDGELLGWIREAYAFSARK